MGKICTCKGCNSTDFDNNGVCLFCGRKYSDMSVVDETVRTQLSLAREAIQGNYDFADALRKSQKVLEEFPQNEEANWLALLAQNYIIYIKNGKGEYVPSFLYPEKSSINQSKYYKNLNAERKQRADAIELKRQAVLEEWKKVEQKPYDVFISYKQHEIENSSIETPEARIARNLYTTLLKDHRTSGYKIFFAEDTLKGSNADWEAQIYSAIKSAKIMIVVASSINNMNARWVENEWLRFLLYKKQGEKKELAILGTSKKDLDPNLFPEPIKDTKTQAVYLEEDWGPSLCERVKEAVDTKSAFALSEERIKQKKRVVIDKKKHELHESVLSFEHKSSEIKLELDKKLDQIDSALKLSHKKEAIKRLIELKKERNDWYNDGQILFYDLVVKFEISGKEAIINNPSNIEKIFDADLFKRIIENTTQEWAYYVLDALYNYVLNSEQTKVKEVLEFILPYQYPKKDNYLTKILKKAELEVNSTVFDLVLPWAKADDRNEILEICQTAFEKEYFTTASKYANLILNDYEKGNTVAQDIVLLSKYNCKDYKQLFSIADINILNELKDILSYLSNEVKCESCGAICNIDESYGPNIKCEHCGKVIVETKMRTERIDKLNEWNEDIIQVAAMQLREDGFSKFKDNFVSFYDGFLRLFPHALQIKKIKEIAELSQIWKAFNVSIHYFEFLLSTTKNQAPIYWAMMLCDLGCADEDNLFTEEFYQRNKNLRIENNKYYKIAFQTAKLGTDFYEHIKKVNEAQQAKFDELQQEETQKNKAKLKYMFGKGALIAVSLLAFFAGQALQYWLYLGQSRVLLLDWFFTNISKYVVIGSSLLNVVLLIFSILIALRLSKGKGFIIHPNLYAWLYVIISGILMSAVPTIAGVVFLIPSIAIYCLIKNRDIQYMPMAFSISTYLIGQVVTWLCYVKYNYSPLFSEILGWIGHSDIQLLYLTITASIISVSSAILISFVGYYCIKNGSSSKTLVVLFPMILLLATIPTASSLVVFIISFILATYFYKDELSDFKIPQISLTLAAMGVTALAFVPNIPLWITLIITAAAFLAGLLLFEHDEYQIQSFLLFALMALAWIVWAMMNLDLIFPKLSTLKEMVSIGLASQAYYEGAYAETRTTMIIGTIVILILAVIGGLCDFGETMEPTTTYAGLTLPLTVIGSIIIYSLIINSLIELPGGASENYSPSFFLWTLIGGVLTAIPGGLYQAGAFFWAQHRSN